MSRKKGVFRLLFSVLFLILICFSLLTFPAYAQAQPKTVRCTITYSPSEPHQGETITIFVNIENIGNVTFSGTATLSLTSGMNAGQTMSYAGSTLNLTNFAPNTAQNRTTTYTAYNEGVYTVLLIISSNDFSYVNVYVGSTLQTSSPQIQFNVVSLDSYLQQESNKTQGQIATYTLLTALFTGIPALIAVVGLTYRRKTKEVSKRDDSLDGLQTLLNKLKEAEAENSLPEVYKIRARYFSKTIKEAIENGKTKLDGKFYTDTNVFFEEINQKNHSP
jgi:hypothetical protein